MWQLRSAKYYLTLLKLKEVTPCLSEHKPLYSLEIYVCLHVFQNVNQPNIPLKEKIQFISQIWFYLY